jgi:two-component system chemotaxis sensor kinase CheA
MNLDELLNSFVVESRELLGDMEQALLGIEERGQPDADSVNAIFRAAHTIKGTAGLFGLEHIVAFTHVAENVLDRVRNGELPLTPERLALLLGVCDHLGLLIEQIAQNQPADADTLAASDKLIAQLSALLDGGQTTAAAEPAPAAPTLRPDPVERENNGQAVSGHWHISLRFGRDLLRDGIDPLSFLRFLGGLGRIVHLVTLVDAVPAAADMDPESCYLGFEIAFQSDASKKDIEDAFEFARPDSLVRILPPRSKIDEYVQLIREQPEEDLRLGEILVKCGTLTPAELESALRSQAQAQRLIGEVLVEQATVEPEVLEAALAKQQQAKERKHSENNAIRVDAGKLDRLIDLVGELVIAGAGANLAAQRLGIVELYEVTATIAQLVEEVRDSALGLRMVPIGTAFSRFQRVVRDVSKELGKDIRLELSGMETELDKTVMEKIGDPLTHLVRNAMDHGIEAAERRLAAGKPEFGTIKLSAYQDAGSIVIEVADDGGGLNRDRILAKAIERGLLDAAQAEAMGEHEVYQLVFEPGFSTAEQISNLSGRGVGMDVVRSNIQALRGAIELDSRPGRGTTVRIALPLTLAIIDGFLVRVGDTAYVVPLEAVVECVELEQTRLPGESHHLNLRGEVLPYVRLRELFDVAGADVRREKVVVVRYGGHKAGLAVDRLLGECQTVIKPLGQVFGQAPGLGGFTILGSGEVAMVLDVPRLVRLAGGEETRRNNAAHRRPALAALPA